MGNSFTESQDFGNYLFVIYLIVLPVPHII
jgi:hypothetical protein